MEKNERYIFKNDESGRVEINAEYFRSKFEEILYEESEYYYQEDFDELLNKLIDCLKNPEGKL